MRRERRQLRVRLAPAGAWTLATGAAVTLSWFGVHTVLAGTDYDPPRALPVSEATSASAEPRSSSTHRPRSPSPRSSPPSRPEPEPEKSSKPPETRKPDPDKSPEPTRTRKPSPDPGTGDGKVKGATVTGGRAVFDMGEKSATLVSATPDAGWDMRVWDDRTWIRVTFTKGDASATVFCRWNDSAPRIETFTQ